ncbi:MAG: hypothetical protein ACLQIB_31875 [Isosphaeraceae bacterium]
MHATVVTMLMTLASLGCYNKEDDEVNAAPAVSASPMEGDLGPDANAGAIAAPMVDPPPNFAGPPPVSHAPGPDHSVGHIFYETLYSFFHGHDDDVMTAKEIESAFYSGAYSGVNEYSPSAVLSSDAPR